jgi:hypothetical protein
MRIEETTKWNTKKAKSYHGSGGQGRMEQAEIFKASHSGLCNVKRVA